MQIRPIYRFLSIIKQIQKLKILIKTIKLNVKKYLLQQKHLRLGKLQVEYSHMQKISIYHVFGKK